MAIRARFVGKQDAEGQPLEYLTGVPARDLQDDEYDALDRRQRAAVRDSGLYKMSEPKSKKADREEEAAEQPAEGGGDA